MPQSTTTRLSEKPAKPSPDFPLFPHATRRWAKKINGKFRFFGPWEDPDGALKNWLREKDDVSTPTKHSATLQGPTIKEIVAHFLTAKSSVFSSGELSARSLQDYHDTCSRILEMFGGTTLVAESGPPHFAKYRSRIAERWGPVALGNEVQRVRSVFKYIFEAGLIPAAPTFGPLFRKPKRRELRLARAAAPAKFFAADEIRAVLGAAKPQIRAMILLGINCGWGNTDIAMLQMKHLNLQEGMADYPRNKTGIGRRAPLWPETVAAIRKAIRMRPVPKFTEDKDCVFITNMVSDGKGF